MLRTALVSGLAFLCAAPALGGDNTTPIDAALVGTNWAFDCSKAADATNYRLTYKFGTNGVLVEAMQSAPGADKVRELRNVQPISDGWLLYTMTDEDKEAVNILTRFKGDQKKSWWSVGKDGTNYILAGKFPDGGEPPWFNKCK